MISTALYAFERSVKYLRHHPQVIFILLLIIVMPVLFLYSGQQFLDAGRSNQERLQKDRIGLLHDSFVAVLSATNVDTAILQSQITELVKNNPDFIQFQVVIHKPGEVRVIAAANQEMVGTIETNVEPYRFSTINLDESFIVEVQRSKEHYWQAFRSVRHTDDNLYTIFTEQSLTQIDAVFSAREREAYYSLVVIYLFIFGLAFWHIKLTDYRYLYQKVAKANEMKDLFTNMIAHELRAPITAIRGYASLLEEDTTLAGTQREQAGKISKSSIRLLTVINDFLDIARMQSGKLSVEKKPTNISEVVQAVCSELSIQAKEKNIALIHSDTDIAHIINTDGKRLHQVLINIVNNSIKYTESGTIEVALFENDTKLEIRVKDTGMGINADEQKNLFVPFHRVEGEETKTITGTGLGMWITKQLVDLLGASIGVESIKSVGTHVVITFPKHS